MTYLGAAPAVGKHRFLSVQDNGDGVITFDATFDLGGNLLSAAAVSSQSLSMSLDFEGIAQVGNSLFLSEENGPGVREYDPATGGELQSVLIPTLFSAANRANLGFESLAYDAAGLTTLDGQRGCADSRRRSGHRCGGYNGAIVRTELSV